MKTSNRYRNHWNFSILSIIDGKSSKLLERDDIVKQLNELDADVAKQKKQIQQLREALRLSMHEDWADHVLGLVDAIDRPSFANVSSCLTIALAMNESGGDL